MDQMCDFIRLNLKAVVQNAQLPCRSPCFDAKWKYHLMENNPWYSKTYFERNAR